ncbi:threonine/homoserine/homoserine lactone efflux protein [Azospirillum fermentarium]|uniref:LysE family translocator n=1 Tax=Azospirillum fermentarium TaxID=1233114 RepID=UPI002226195E|nr:LysE family translocator [Azospirillum fermentarium]MCW2248536.1 threonine/homoserine/homoserine lactone efflux protein [Azospirillum fermentarium]
MSWNTLGLFLVTFFFISATPGPNMLLAMSLGLRFGVGRAAWGGIGMVSGLVVLASLSVLGLGALLAASEPAFLTLKWAGVAYLTWLGWQTWRAPAAPVTPGDAPPVSGEGSAGRLFVRGLLVTFSNPKALVFMAALFPQFIEPAQPLLPQFVTLVALMAAIEFGWILTYAAGGHTLAARLSSTTAVRSLNRLSGGLMIGAGGLLALAKRI